MHMYLHITDSLAVHIINGDQTNNTFFVYLLIFDPKKKPLKCKKKFKKDFASTFFFLKFVRQKDRQKQSFYASLFPHHFSELCC